MLDILKTPSIKTTIDHMVDYTVHVAEDTLRLFKTRNIEERVSTWNRVEERVFVLEDHRRELVSNILLYIAGRQPLGRELLSAYVLLSIAYDLYRISRYLREIMLVDKLLSPERGLCDLGDIMEVLYKAIEALNCALRDLRELNQSNRECVYRIDDEVDTLYSSILRRVVSSDRVENIDALRVLLMRHIERIIDHAVYIENYLGELT